MAKSSKKYYVVWAGREPGVFDTWASCRASVEGYEGARYKSFPSRELAHAAYEEGPQQHLKKASRGGAAGREEGGSGKGAPNGGPAPGGTGSPPPYILNSIAVDAACNMVTGRMEYQGVYTDGRQPLFHQGPFEAGSNNIGEFLAIVHALAWCKKHHTDLPVYTDSITAIAWVRNKKANTRVARNPKNKALFDLILRAENWLKANTWQNPILKWNTEEWGEIPADFGRK